MEVWNSRRSTVYSTKGMVACTQPLAASIGKSVLENGGTAADAAVAMAAALNVVEPCSTGIGGDAFALYYSASTREVSCYMGNGSAPEALTLELLDSRGIGVNKEPLSQFSGLCVTVPGAAALWEDLVKAHGALPLQTVLAPAVELAENGFVLGPVTARQWANGQLTGDEAHRVFRPDGQSPGTGEIVRNSDLASTFRELGRLGAAESFYSGRIAEAIVEAAAAFGGVLGMTDLQSHRTVKTSPSSVVYKGHRIHETPPPTHGLAALLAMNIMEELCPDGSAAEAGERQRGSVQQAHLGIEAMRLAFADALQFVSDPAKTSVPEESLLSKAYAQHRAASIRANGDRSNDHVEAGNPLDVEPFQTSETVYFCVVDSMGNGCSMINSNYHGFGTGIVPRGCGFTLQNRGQNFSLDPSHPNAVAPFKKPYHTIIPALVTRESDGSLFSTMGVMGGFMQPQGHLQVLRNMIDFGMDPQAALDAPRWYVAHVGDTQSPADVQRSLVVIEQGYGGRWDGGGDGEISMEVMVGPDGVLLGEGPGTVGDDGERMVNELEKRGHRVLYLAKGNQRTIFGRGQVIVRNERTGVLSGGTDPRTDGACMPTTR